MKTSEEIAKEVIAGKWGSGEDRKERLKAAGYDPTTVQALVNQMLKPDPADVLAKEIAEKVKSSGLDPADVMGRTMKVLGLS